MPKSTTAPAANLYTSTEVRSMLDISGTQLANLVDRGVILKVVPPGKKNGFYTKESVDDYVTQQQIFMKLHTGVKGKLIARKARLEDQQKIFELEAKVYGSERNTVPLNLRIDWFKKNPNIDFIVVDGDEIVGHLAIIPMEMKIIEAIIKGEQAWPRDNKEIQKYEAGKRHNVFIMSAAVLQDTPVQGMSRYYAASLLNTAIKGIEELAAEGKLIKAVYATSRTEQGILLGIKMDFDVDKEVSTSKRKAFVMDMEHSQSLTAKRYRHHIDELKLEDLHKQFVDI